MRRTVFPLTHMCQLVRRNKCTSCIARDFNLLYFSWGESPRSVQALRHKPGYFDSRRVPWKFSGDLFLLSASSSRRFHSASNRNFLENEVRPELTADNSAVPVGPNVQVRMEAQHSVPHLSRDFVTFHGKALLLTFFILCFLAKASTTNNFLHKSSRIKKIMPRFNPRICMKY